MAAVSEAAMDCPQRSKVRHENGDEVAGSSMPVTSGSGGRGWQPSCGMPLPPLRHHLGWHGAAALKSRSSGSLGRGLCRGGSGCATTAVIAAGYITSLHGGRRVHRMRMGLLGRAATPQASVTPQISIGSS